MALCDSAMVISKETQVRALPLGQRARARARPRPREPRTCALRLFGAGRPVSLSGMLSCSLVSRHSTRSQILACQPATHRPGREKILACQRDQGAGKTFFNSYLGINSAGGAGIGIKPTGAPGGERATRGAPRGEPA